MFGLPHWHWVPLLTIQTGTGNRLNFRQYLRKFPPIPRQIFSARALSQPEWKSRQWPRTFFQPAGHFVSLLTRQTGGTCSRLNFRQYMRKFAPIPRQNSFARALSQPEWKSRQWPPTFFQPAGHSPLEHRRAKSFGSVSDNNSFKNVVFRLPLTE